MAVQSIGEEYQELLDKGLSEEEAKAVMDVRHKRVTTGLDCPKCKSKNTYRRGKRCSHEYKCRDCNYWWCAYYQLMTSEERQMRKDWSKSRKLKKTAKSDSERIDPNE